VARWIPSSTASQGGPTSSGRSEDPWNLAVLRRRTWPGALGELPLVAVDESPQRCDPLGLFPDLPQVGARLESLDGSHDAPAPRPERHALAPHAVDRGSQVLQP